MGFLNRKMGRLPYLIISLVVAALVALVAFQTALSLDVIAAKVIGQTPGLRASASANAGGAAYRRDFDDGCPCDNATETGADARADARVSLYRSPEDARDIRSNYLLMYEAGTQHMLSVVVIAAGLVVFIFASIFRFHDLGQSGYFTFLLFLPVPFVLWLYLVLAPGKPAGGGGGTTPPTGYGPGMSGIYITKTNQTIIV